MSTAVTARPSAPPSPASSSSVRVRRAESAGTAAATAAAASLDSLVDASAAAVAVGADDDADDSVDASPERAFLADLAHALYSAGAPTHELEEALARVARALQLRCQLFASPTMLTIDFRAQGGLGPRTYTARPRGGMHLFRQAQLLDLARAVASESLPLAEACARMDAIVDAAPLYALGVQLLGELAAGLLPAVVFFGGGLREAAVACALSLLHGLLMLACESSPRLARLRYFLMGAGAGFVARSAHALGATSCVLSVAISGIVVSLPGLPFTIALSEVVYGSLTAGTTRFAQSSIQTLQIGLGLAVGVQAVWFATDEWTMGTDTCAPPGGAVPVWAKALATVVGFVSLSLSLNAHWRQWVIMWLAAAASLCVVLFGRSWGLTTEGVNVCASVALGLVASALCYLVKVQPQAYFYLGVILLVPGSVGAREAATAFEGGDARSGSTFAMDMVSVSLALTVGLLLSRSLFPDSFFRHTAGPSPWAQLFTPVAPLPHHSHRRRATAAYRGAAARGGGAGGGGGGGSAGGGASGMVEADSERVAIRTAVDAPH